MLKIISHDHAHSLVQLALFRTLFQFKLRFLLPLLLTLLSLTLLNPTASALEKRNSVSIHFAETDNDFSAAGPTQSDSFSNLGFEASHKLGEYIDIGIGYSDFGSINALELFNNNLSGFEGLINDSLTEAEVSGETLRLFLVAHAPLSDWLGHKEAPVRLSLRARYGASFSRFVFEASGAKISAPDPDNLPNPGDPIPTEPASKSNALNGLDDFWSVGLYLSVASNLAFSLDYTEDKIDFDIGNADIRFKSESVTAGVHFRF